MEPMVCKSRTTVTIILVDYRNNSIGELVIRQRHPRVRVRCFARELVKNSIMAMKD